MSKASSSVAKRTARRASDAVGSAAELAGGLVGTASQSAAATAAKGAVVAGAAKAASGVKTAGAVAGAKASEAAHAAQTAAAARAAKVGETAADQRELHLSALPDRHAVADQVSQAGQSTWDGTRALSEALREGALSAPAIDPRLVEAAARVRDDITPRVATALMTALESSRPNREEALRRASAAVAALRGEALAVAEGGASANSGSSPTRDEGNGGGRGKRVLLILLVAGAIAAVAKAVLARRAEQDAAEIWQTGEGFSAGSVPAAHDDHHEETVAGTPLLSAEPGSSAVPATSADAGGAGPDEAVADLQDEDMVATADATDATDSTDLAGPLGEGQVDLRDEGTRGRHSRG